MSFSVAIDLPLHALVTLIIVLYIKRTISEKCLDSVFKKLSTRAVWFKLVFKDKFGSQ